MKLKTMLKFCKAAKYIEVVGYGNHKYLSSGNVMMCTDKVAPDWYSDDFATMLEIDKEALNSFYTGDNVGHSAFELLEVMDFTKVGRLDFSVTAAGIVLVPFALPSDDIFFIDDDKLAVFADIGIKQYYYGKWNNQPALYIAVDTMVIGAIIGEKVNLSAMKDFAGTLHKGVAKSASIGFLDAGGQIMIDM